MINYLEALNYRPFTKVKFSRSVRVNKRVLWWIFLALLSPIWVFPYTLYIMYDSLYELAEQDILREDFNAENRIKTS
jgi:hypothetical protein